MRIESLASELETLPVLTRIRREAEIATLPA